MKNVEILDKEKGEVILGAGLTLGRTVLELSQNAGLAFPAGHCASVGVTGLILGGGQGVLSRHLGMTSDYVSRELVD
jgi:FAD/FMN-containing dehydrogenase